MNKDQVIDNFFEVFKSIKINNPTFQVDHNLMYYALTRLGTFSDNRYLLCRNEELHQIIKRDGFFDRWVSRFSNSYNTNVFVADNWNYFCQFKSGDVINNNDGEFIKNDQYIQEGLLPANPFAFNKNGVALACDGMTSYNSVLSVFLEQFINQNDAGNLTSENFYNYLYSFYNGIVNDTIDSKTFILTSFASKPSVEDFERILVLLINSHNPEFTYDDYINHFYNGCKNITYQQQSQPTTNIEEVIYNILCVMRQTQDLYDCARSLYAYISTGDENYITDIDNLKQGVVNSNFRNDALNLLHSSDTNFINICYNIVNKYENQENYENSNEKRAVA